MEKHIKEINYKGFKIVIDNDPFCENPRNWVESKWYGVDKNAPADLILNEDGKINPSCDELKDKFWFKVYKYEHSGVSFSLSPVDKWDSSFYGIIAVSKASLSTEDEARKIIECELSEYSQWCNGEVYGYQIFDANDLNNAIDSCWSFFDLDQCEEDARGIVAAFAEQKEKDSVCFWANNSD